MSRAAVKVEDVRLGGEDAQEDVWVDATSRSTRALGEDCGEGHEGSVCWVRVMQGGGVEVDYGFALGDLEGGSDGV